MFESSSKVADYVKLTMNAVQATRARISERYYWPLMFEDVKFYVKTCEACQKADIAISSLYVMTFRGGSKPRWHKDAKTWVKLVENEVLYRFGNVKKIVTDGGELSSALGMEM